MFSRQQRDSQTEKLILDAEREAQMVSALARLIVVSIAIVIFLGSGGYRLPVASVVLTYLCSYGVVSVASVVFSLRRFFHPWLSLLFTAIDGISLALLIGFALRVTQIPPSYHAAVPGFVFVFPILILATMRYTVGPVVVAFASFSLTWLVFSFALGPSRTEPGPVDPSFFFGTVQNAARWGFVTIAALLALLAVIRRRRTLEQAIAAARASANLSRYLPDRVANVAAAQGIDALTLGQRQAATVLFADIRGFTGISEAMSPEVLSKLLGKFRSLVLAEVEQHSGIVDKFIGDAVMAVFGVPDAQPDHAQNGLACGLAIRIAVADWNAERVTSGSEPIKVTIGIHSGEVFAGAIGSAARMEYTVLGDTVNIAARLQEKAKDTASGLVASQDVLGQSDPVQRWEPMGESTIRGRDGKISLFVLKSPADPQAD